MSEHSEIASRLREARIRQGLTQTEAAEKCGLSQSQFSRVESGRTIKWTPAVRAGAAEILGITLQRLNELLTASPEAAYESFVASMDDQAQKFLAMEDRIESLTALLENLMVDPEPGPRALGRALHAKRVDHGQSLTQVSRALGCSPHSVYWMERGAFHPWQYRRELSLFLEVDPHVVDELSVAESVESALSTLEEMRLRVSDMATIVREAERNLTVAEGAMNEIEEQERTAVRSGHAPWGVDDSRPGIA